MSYDIWNKLDAAKGIDFLFMYAYNKFHDREQIMAWKIPHFYLICVSVTGLIPVSVTEVQQPS